ncbi:MAG: hypothetical protein ACE5G6_06235 [Terriglobia bacterium]
MFDRQRAVLRAAGLGYLLSGFLLAVALGWAATVLREDPYRRAQELDQFLGLRAGQMGAVVLVGVLVFVAALAGLIFALAVAARARRLHPTSATLGGILLGAGLLAVMATSVWVGLVTPIAAMQYQASHDLPSPQAAETRRQTLLVAAQLGEHILLLGYWCFLGLAAPGLYFLGRALRGERGWTPDILKLAAAVIVLHLPVTLYLARESLIHGRWVGGLAALDQLLLWSALAVAGYFAARWLRRVGRSLPL